MKRLLSAAAALVLSCTPVAPKAGEVCEQSDCDFYNQNIALFCMERDEGAAYKSFPCRGGCTYSERASAGIVCDPRGAEPGDRCPPPLARERTCSARREVLECANGVWQLMESCEGVCFVNVNGVGAKCAAK